MIPSTTATRPVHTWQHSPLLQAKRKGQAKAIHALVQNGVVTAEEELIRAGLPVVGAKDVINRLVIRGVDMFDLSQTEDEASWYAARQRAVEVENSRRSGGVSQRPTVESVEAHSARQEAKAAKKSRQAKAALAHRPFHAPVQGPSLVLSESRLFFPLRQGPITAVTTASEAEEDSSLVSSASSVPGEHDRVSRKVTLTNNGSTAVEYEWRVELGALAAEAAKAKEESESPLIASTKPLLHSADPTNFFIASQPKGTLLPGESADIFFTFIPTGVTGGGVFVQRLNLETVPKLSRPLTEKHSFLTQESQQKGHENLPSSPALILTGSITSLDTTSVIRADFYKKLVDSKNKHIVAAEVHKAAWMVRDPAPEPELHRQIFYTRNRDQKLFYYAELMSQWHALAQDIFNVQKRFLRRTLVWDFSATTLHRWIDATPRRHFDKKNDLFQRYIKLVQACSIRPAPHQQRYDICFGLLSNLISSIPRLSHRFAIETGTSEPLEQDLRRELAEKKKKEDEELRAKLPFHLRNVGAQNPGALTPEQRKMREEEEARVAAAAAVQAAEDATKRAERAEALAKASTKLHDEVKAQLTETLTYFDFLAAPQNTNLDPKAMNTTAQATTEVNAPTAATIAQDLAVLKPVPPPVIEAPTKSSATKKKESVSSNEAKETDPTSPQSTTTKSKSSSKTQASPRTSRPVTPNSLNPAGLPGANDNGVPLTPSDDAQLALALSSPHLFTPNELEQIRAKAFHDFLALENQRRASGSPSVKQRIVYIGNGYSTPDTGVHIPTAAEVKLKEERDRMARYGQVVPAAIREAEEARKRDMHPMACLATRQILLTAAGVYFSLAYTRERGIYAWAAQDPPERLSSSSDDLPPNSPSTAGKKKTVSVTSVSSSKGGAGSGAKTKIQEARKAVLGLLNPLLNATNSSTIKTPEKASSTSKASDSKEKDKSAGKASPRSTSTAASSSSSTTTKSNSNKKTSSGSRPGSSSGAARSMSPGPSATQPSLLPAIPVALQPMGALTYSAGGSAPLPVYIPELQGYDLVSIALGVHVAFFVTSLGSLLAWEHATRRLQLLYQRTYPGLKELQTHRYTLKAIELQREKDRNAPAEIVDRPPSRGGAVVESDGRSTKRTGEVSSRKVAKEPSTTSMKSPRSTKGGRGAKGEAEILAIDSVAYEMEAARQDRLAKDADFLTAGKQIAKVVVGGSATLSGQIHYPSAATDFEFILILTTDGCVYSSMVTPPPIVDLVGGKSGAAATAATAKSAAKDREQGIAMLGLGEKTKEQAKNEKEAVKSGEAALAPLVHFELVTTLHPANLSLPSAVSSSSSPSDIRVVQLTAGYGHALALCSDGSVYVWGLEGAQLGLGADKESKKPRFLPTKIESLSQIALPVLVTAADKLAPTATDSTTAAAPSSGSKSPVPGIKARPGSGTKDAPRSARGSGPLTTTTTASGKKGEKVDPSAPSPVPSGEETVPGPNDPIVAIASGSYHNLALTASGAVFAWGRNSEGQLGLEGKDRDVPTLVPTLSPSHHPIALVQALEKANAPVIKQPTHGAGRFGAAVAASSSSTIIPPLSSSSPITFSPFLQVRSIVCGGAHSVVVATPRPQATLVDADGNERQLATSSVFAFGAGGAGATGLGPACEDTCVPTPIEYFQGQDVQSLIASGDCTQAIVKREANNVITLVADEDDIPNAVLIN